MSNSRDIFFRARARAAELAIDLFGTPNEMLSNEHELRFGNNGSIKVVISGQYSGRATDWSEDFHGDIVDLFARCHGTSGHYTVEKLREWLGETKSSQEATAKSPANLGPNLEISRDRYDAAKLLWEKATDIRGTLAEEYLVDRLGGLPIPQSVLACKVLRWLENLEASDVAGVMIAAMQDPITGKPTGIHRTFVSHDKKKVKVSLLGSRNPIRLAKLGTPGPVLVAEGIETAISAGILFDNSNIYAAGSAGALATLPVFGSEGIVICGDNDLPNSVGSRVGPIAMNECAARWAAGNRNVITRLPAEEGHDFNDLLRSFSNAE